MTEGEGDEPTFDWAGLVLLLVHPARVTIIEALSYVGRSLSPTDLKQILGSEFTLSFVAYHVRELHKLGVLRKVKTRQVRGATETYYFLSKPS